MKKFLLFLILFIPCIINAYDFTIDPIDYVDGDSTMLESNGQYLLIDVGYWINNNVINYLQTNNINKFDIYLSHYDGDHWGLNKNDSNKNLIDELMSQNGIKYTIKNIYIPAIKKRSKLTGSYGEYPLSKCSSIKSSDPDALRYECAIYQRHDHFVKTAKKYGVNVIELKTGSKFKVGNIEAEVLYLNLDASINRQLNNSSLVTMFTNGKVKFLTAGDIEKITEEDILKKGINIKADIFKLSHHGIWSTNGKSNNPAFLQKVNPKYVYNQMRYTESLFWKKGKFVGSLIGNGYYYIDDESKKQLNDIANLYSYWTYGSHVQGKDSALVQTKFLIDGNDIFPVIENINIDNGRTITINYIDKTTNQVLKSKKYQFSLYSYVTDQGKYNNKYHLHNTKENFLNYHVVSGDNFPLEGIVNKDLTYNVYYMKDTYKITIKHLNEDGTPLIEDIVKTLEHGSSYNEYANDELLKKYELIVTPENRIGTVTGDTEIKFIYKLRPEEQEEIKTISKKNNIDINKVFPIVIAIITLFIIFSSPKKI